MDRPDRLFASITEIQLLLLEALLAQRNCVVWLQPKAKIEYFQQVISKNATLQPSGTRSNSALPRPHLLTTGLLLSLIMPPLPTLSMTTLYQ